MGAQQISSPQRQGRDILPAEAGAGYPPSRGRGGISSQQRQGRDILPADGPAAALLSVVWYGILHYIPVRVGGIEGMAAVRRSTAIGVCVCKVKAVRKGTTRP